MSYLSAHNKKPPTRQLQMRINLNYRPLSRLSMDLKVMPRSYKGHKWILCVIDKVTNYLITVPIHHANLEDSWYINRKYYNKILHTGINNNGSR